MNTELKNSTATVRVMYMDSGKTVEVPARSAKEGDFWESIVSAASDGLLPISAPEGYMICAHSSGDIETGLYFRRIPTPKRFVDISSVRLASGAEVPMVEFRTLDGREGAEYLDEDGEVETGPDAHMRSMSGFSRDEVEDILAELEQIRPNNWEFTDTAA